MHQELTGYAVFLIPGGEVGASLSSTIRKLAAEYGRKNASTRENKQEIPKTKSGRIIPTGPLLMVAKVIKRIGQKGKTLKDFSCQTKIESSAAAKLALCNNSTLAVALALNHSKEVAKIKTEKKACFSE